MMANYTLYHLSYMATHKLTSVQLDFFFYVKITFLVDIDPELMM
jgi:hypothetical protein